MIRLFLVISDPKANIEGVRIPVICWNQRAALLVSHGREKGLPTDADLSFQSFDVPDEISESLLSAIAGPGTAGLILNRDHFIQNDPLAFLAYMPDDRMSAWCRVPEGTRREMEERVRPLMLCL